MTKRIRKVIYTSFLIVFLLGYIGTIIPSSVVASLLDIKVYAEDDDPEEPEIPDPTILDTVDIENVNIPSSIASNETITFDEWMDPFAFTESDYYEIINVYWENQSGDPIDDGTPLTDSEELYGYIELMSKEDIDVIYNFNENITADDITFNGNTVEDVEIMDVTDIIVKVKVNVESSNSQTEVETIRIGSATLSYLANETPSFSARSLENNLYTVTLEKYADIQNGYFITSDNTLNNPNTLITTFEGGKSYSYSIKITPASNNITLENASVITINSVNYNIILDGNNSNAEIDGGSLYFYGVPNIQIAAPQSYLQIDMIGDTGYNNGTFTYNGGSAYVKIDGIRFSSALTNGNIQITGTSAFVEVVATPIDGYTTTIYINGDERSTAQITSNSSITVLFEEIVQENRYSLTFNTNGGSYIQPITNQTSGTTINLSSYIPTKTDYIFEGWYTEEDLINKVTSITLDSNKTVYANYTSLKGSISLTYNNPTGLSSIKLNGVSINGNSSNGYIYNTQNNTFVITPQNGYTITSVQITDAENVITTAGAAPINEAITVSVAGSTSYDIVITLVQAQTYTLTFETNGGTTIDPLTDRLSGSTIDLGNFNPSKTDYRFEGWYTEEGLVNKVTSITMDSNKTVYAKWIQVQGDISFTYNTPSGLNSIKFNNTNVTSNTVHGYITSDSPNTIIVNPSTSDTYKITSIQVTNAESQTTSYGPYEVGESATIVINGSTSYSLVITIDQTQKYSLSFETNGGTSIQTVQNIIAGTVENLSNYTTTRTDYLFEGWYTEEGLVNKVTSITMDSNKTVYAKWIQVQGDISFTYNTPSGLDSIEFNNTNVTSNTVHGYITSNNTNSIIINPSTSDTYKITSIQVTNAESQTTSYGPYGVGESATITINGSSSYSLVITIDQIQKYSLSFETNGGTSIQTVQNIMAGTVKELSNYTTTRTDYVFEGWYTEEGLVNKVTSITMDSNKTVYAKWIQVQGDITLSYNTPEGFAELAFNNSTVNSSTVHGYITSDNKNTFKISPTYLGGYTIAAVQVTDANNNITSFGPASINDILTFEVDGSTSYTLLITIVKEEIEEEYNVTYNIPGLISSNTSTKITAENDYVTTLSIDSNYIFEEGLLGLVLPKAVMVKVGNVPVNDDIISYNSQNGLLTIPKSIINNDITIIAPALGKVKKPTISESDYSYTGQQINLGVYNYDSRFMDETGTKSETNAGNYSVTYTLSDATYIWADETSEPITFNWVINKEDLSLTVMMSDWKVGSEPSTPVTSGNISNGVEIIEYKSRFESDSKYTTTKPSLPGYYTVRYTVLETTNYNGASVTDSFTITSDKVVVDLPLLVNKTQFYTGYAITIDDIYDSNYITRYNETGYDIGEYTTIYHLKESSYEWPDGSKDDIEFKWNIKYGTPIVTTSSKYNSTTLTWEELPLAYGYQVYECNSKGESCKKLVDTVDLSYTHTNRKFNTKYYYKVRAYTKIDGSKKYGDYTNLIKVTTKLNAPKLKATTNRYQEIKLSWNKESGTEKYYIYKCDEYGENCSQLATTTSNKYTDKKAKEGKYSYYKIRAYRAKKYSSYSDLAEGFRENDNLEVAVKNTGYLKNTITVQYKDGATKYEIEKSTDGKKYTLLKTIEEYEIDPYEGLSYTDKKAKFNKKTYYRVRVNNGVNYSAYVTKDVTAKYLDVPEISASENRYQEVKLTWNAVSGAEKYYIYTCDSYGDNCKELGTSTSNKYTDKKAKEGSNTYYKVKAYKAKIKSKYSNLAIGYRENDNLTVTIKNIDYLQNKITIQNKENAIKYEIYKSTDGKTYSLLKTFDYDDYEFDPFAEYYEFIDKKISYNKKTYYKIRVHNGVNYSAYYEKNITASKLRKPEVNISGTYFSPRFDVISVPKATGYEFYHSNDNSTWTKEQKSSKTSFKKTYEEYDYHYYKVRAYKTDGSKTYYSDYVYINEEDFV